MIRPPAPGAASPARRPPPTGAVFLAAVACAVAALAAARPAASEEPPASAHTVRVATFNAWLIPLVAEDRPARLARLPGALRALDLDVVCLQEVWLPADRRAIREALKDVYPHAVLAGGGLMMLSKLPVARSRFVKFPAYKGLSVGELIAAKGLLDATLRTPVGPVRVVTSHLALAFGEDNPRSKQLRFLLDHLKGLRTEPVLLAADLNTWPVDKGRLTDDYRSIIAEGFVDTKPPVRKHDQRWHPGEPTRYGWPREKEKPEKGWYPDHLLFRPGRTLSVKLRAFRMRLDTPETALSDHNLLQADLRLVARKPAPKAEAK
jgi:endonuclease/exonuclease/phosphatase family metal-dependent hydrolase